MTTRKEIDFKIDHIDPLGQGVYKEADQVYFIPKTLPEETGTAIVLKSKKNIHFCELTELKTQSPKRIESECPHFSKCSGCQFLHTDYEQELEFKLNSFKRMLRDFDTEKINVIKSPKRLHYRNRVQLQVKNNKIGFYKPFVKEVTNVENCKIMMPEIEREFKNTALQKPKRIRSHIEIYYKDSQVQVTADSQYAHGGFTQVNGPTNKLMGEQLSKLFKDHKDLNVLDLFAGDGNLSDNLNYASRVCMDIYPQDHKEFLNVDLFKPNSIHKMRETNFDLLLLDPPRSGFKDLNNWALKYRPKEIIYISCHPMTMVRDLKELHSSYKIQNVFLVDLFPSTHHFEGFIHLKAQSE